MTAALGECGRGDVLLQARGLRHTFGRTTALAGVDLDVVSGEVLAVMGPSGSGKSTLLHALAGVIAPDQGVVTYAGHAISGLGEAQRARLRLREFGFIFQFGQLLPDLSALDNVSIPLMLAGMRRRQALATAAEHLARLELADHGDKRPGEMSGGQAQRVAVARALAMNPRVLFADEPTGSLDSLTAERTMEAMTDLARGAGTTLVIITHDPRTASYADREVVVRDGRITGNVHEGAR